MEYTVDNDIQIGRQQKRRRLKQCVEVDTFTMQQDISCSDPYVWGDRFCDDDSRRHRLHRDSSSPDTASKCSKAWCAPCGDPCPQQRFTAMVPLPILLEDGSVKLNEDEDTLSQSTSGDSSDESDFDFGSEVDFSDGAESDSSEDEDHAPMNHHVHIAEHERVIIQPDATERNVAVEKGLLQAQSTWQAVHRTRKFSHGVVNWTRQHHHMFSLQDRARIRTVMLCMLRARKVHCEASADTAYLTGSTSPVVPCGALPREIVEHILTLQPARPGPCTVSTIAGGGRRGYLDGPAQNAAFMSPRNICIDVDGSILVSDTCNDCIRRITPDRSRVHTLAGTGGVEGHMDGPVEEAKFNSPRGIAIDNAGSVIISDTDNHCIRKIAGGVVTTVAGSPQSPGLADGDKTNGRLNRPYGLRINPNGDGVLVADGDNYRVCHVNAAGFVTSIAGSGRCGLRDGPVHLAEFTSPRQLAVIDDHSLLVTDSFSNRIRLVRSNESTVYTYGGVPYEAPTAPASAPAWLAPVRSGASVKLGNASRCSDALWAEQRSNVDDGAVAGAVPPQPLPQDVYVPAPATAPMHYDAATRAFGTARVPNTHDIPIEKTSPARASPVHIHHAVFDVPNEVMVDGAGAVFVTEGNKYTGKNNRIRMINSHTGAVQTLVGCDDAMPGYVDGSTTVASANHPIGIAVDDDGCLVFADSDNHCIRSVRCVELLLA
eukprot:m.1262555 g.1262555  ORF g.1262555 m.1262555 type:complete len:712 (-) comp24733_c0_seq60:3232-5367(-)